MQQFAIYNNQCKKTSQFKTHVMPLKQQKINVFDPVICKIPDAPLPDKQLRRTCVVYHYFYWLLLFYANFFAKLSVYDSNCALHYRIMLEARSKRGEGNDLYF